MGTFSAATFIAALLLGAAGPATAAPEAAPGCTAQAPCYTAFTPDTAPSGQLHYYASAAPGSADTPPTQVLIALHGHSRDATKTYAAALAATQAAGKAALTLVIAPLFQVADSPGRHGRGCSSAGVPGPQDGDLLWTCNSWPAGERAAGGGPTAYAVLDALIQHLHQQWPSLQRATLGGFSAGGQFVQRYVGFAEVRRPHPFPVRYVVADPGSWLYFDPERPVPLRQGAAVDWDDCLDGLSASGSEGACTLHWRAPSPSCPAENRWKHGTEALPADLIRSAAEARSRYAAADVRYLQGSADTGSGKGSAYSVLERTCAALAQGPFRLQRGLAYAAYDRLRLATARPRQVGIAPGCAHDVACVFPSEAGRRALFGD